MNARVDIVLLKSSANVLESAFVLELLRFLLSQYRIVFLMGVGEDVVTFVAGDVHSDLLFLPISGGCALLLQDSWFASWSHLFARVAFLRPMLATLHL
jgi:hypothetical protein